MTMIDPNIAALLAQFGLDAAALDTLLLSTALITVLSVATAIPTGIVAQQKRRSRIFWVTFALTIPVVPLLLVWWLPAAENPP